MTLIERFKCHHQKYILQYFEWHFYFLSFTVIFHGTEPVPQNQTNKSIFLFQKQLEDYLNKLLRMAMYRNYYATVSSLLIMEFRPW